MYEKLMAVNGTPNQRWLLAEAWERVRSALLQKLEEFILVLLLLGKDGIIAVCLRIGAWAFHELGKYTSLG